MSIVAWDGKIIAADKQGTYGELVKTGTKIFKLKKEVFAFVGPVGSGLAMLDWYKSGADIKTWPEWQRNDDFWAQIIIANKTSCRFYDQFPYSRKVEGSFSAWGSGANVAIGAMDMGASAIKAVEIACKYINSCGCGIDWFEL